MKPCLVPGFFMGVTGAPESFVIDSQRVIRPTQSDLITPSG